MRENKDSRELDFKDDKHRESRVLYCATDSRGTSLSCSNRCAKILVVSEGEKNTQKHERKLNRIEDGSERRQHACLCVR